MLTDIPYICHFFSRAKFLENKIYTEKKRKLRQNTHKIANFLRCYGGRQTRTNGSVLQRSRAALVVRVSKN